MRSFVLLICTVAALSLPDTAPAAPGGDIAGLLRQRGTELVRSASVRGNGDGPAVFAAFRDMLLTELTASGDGASAAALRSALDGATDSVARHALAWTVQTYTREFYGDRIIDATSRLIRFRTFATDVPNRLNPEFIRQKEYIAALAESLGLGFRDVDGYVQEISIGSGGESFGMMVHSDVQPVDESEWTHEPWEGEVSGGAIRGRGSIDDKGALVAIMYGMRALLDSGVPLRNRLILLVGTDEESANEDITTYLTSNPPPARTIVVDYAYPLYCAEKGWCGVWMKAALAGDSAAGSAIGPAITLTGIRSGFSPSIVPGAATATFRASGIPADSAAAILRRGAERFMEERAGSSILISVSDGGVTATATGRSVHSSVPETGHNALMDLLVWIDRTVKPAAGNLALMAKFASDYIGLELDGRSLGIAHTDPFMGKVTVAGDMFVTDADSLMFMFNFRVPKGKESAFYRTAIADRIREFSSAHGIDFSTQMYVSEPFYKDPDDPFIRRLLGIYGEVTGESAEARSMGGGTYARRIPNAVVFGPGLHDDEYRGHQPDEYITIDALMLNIGILTHTMTEFGLK